MTDYEIMKLSWEDIVELSEKIYASICDKKIDTLIPILRGGMPLALLLSSRMKNVNMSCIHIRRSQTDDTNASFTFPEFKGITNFQQIANKNILICEDIVDHGDSLDFAIEHLKKYNPKSITIATLVNFNNGKYKDIISGKNMKNYYWILFPWERE